MGIMKTDCRNISTCTNFELKIVIDLAKNDTVDQKFVC